MIKYDFTDKNVIVTGAGSGLGKSIATEFAKAGANVVIADLNEEAATTVSAELAQYGKNIVPYQVDVSNYEEVENMITGITKLLGSIDILVNNAGICKAEPLIDMDMNFADKMIKINLNGTIYGCKAVLPQMIKQNKGKIVNMSSIAAKMGGVGASVYSATKAGVLELTACLAREYAKNNINVNCVLPGIIRTPLWEKMLDEMTNNDPSKKDEVFASFTKEIPLGRPQDEIDIAFAVLFLCTEEADNITAQNLGVDGGETY
jgi:NAD(P)-dependent dehydrogenase (short-subunit alcohol dehydrogenase family)